MDPTYNFCPFEQPYPNSNLREGATLRSLFSLSSLIYLKFIKCVTRRASAFTAGISHVFRVSCFILSAPGMLYTCLRGHRDLVPAGV